jgi:CRP/FNR family transcriptional regulator, cyclic AMP receptor protein
MRTKSGSENGENCQTGSVRDQGFFRNLSGAALKALDGIRFTTTYPEGALLFAEGDTPRGVMVLDRGCAKVSMMSREGRILILRVAQTGEVLGLTSVISNTPCQTSVETLERSQVNFYQRKEFLRILVEHGDASLAAAEQLSQCYAMVCEQARSIGLFRSVPERLARFLLAWTAEGLQTGHSSSTVLPLSQEEIGQMIGASRETVTRTLGMFRDRHLASFKGTVLMIPDRSALARLVNPESRGRPV